jgi:hypothetical protein
MASRRVNLFKYVNLPGVGWRYCKALFYDNGRIKAHAVLTPTGEQVVKDGYYVLSYARKFEPVGNDPTEAARQLFKKRGELQTVANGGTILHTEQSMVSGTLRAALDDWLQEIKDKDADEDTYDAKRLVADEFVESLGKRVTLLSAVTRQHCLRYIGEWLKKQGNSNRTRYNKYLHLRQFLVEYAKLPDHLTSNDAPDYEIQDPIAIEDDELAIFWKHCPPHKRLLYTLLLICGLRKGEIQTLRWADILWTEELIRIQARPEYNYFPKKHHCRDLPIYDPEIMEELRRRKAASKSPLVFHTKSGNVEQRVVVSDAVDDVVAVCFTLDHVHRQRCDG